MLDWKVIMCYAVIRRVYIMYVRNQDRDQFKDGLKESQGFLSYGASITR